jgi:hypothetical protein
MRADDRIAMLPHLRQISIGQFLPIHLLHHPFHDQQYHHDQRLNPALSTLIATMSALNANTTHNSYPAMNPATAFTTTESNSDSTGTIIFGVIASVLALMAIIIGILQLRKSKAHRQPDGGV